MDYSLNFRIDCSKFAGTGLAMAFQSQMSFMYQCLGSSIDEIRIKGDYDENNVQFLIVQIKFYEVPANKQFVRTKQEEILQTFGNAIVFED